MTMNKLPDAELLFANLLSQIKPLINEHSALIGIHSGGAWLMQRMLNELTPAPVHGTLDVSFYRDDYHQRGLHHEPKPSHIPFDVEKRHIILIDDVFYTGRTIRAAMNELFDYGRPASITLAVLINRGGQELPIAPQICAHQMQVAEQQNIQLLQQPDGRFYLQLED
jgi:pyrimidine operon attenuation protein/uracil phosphoribosyltransferase